MRSSFAERLRQVGADFDREVCEFMQSTVQTAQNEARVLCDEVEWLQRQLEDERQQSAARLGLCAEFKRQLQEVQEAHQQESEAREFWQRECAAFEERHCLLEAKLAALAMSEPEENREQSVQETADDGLPPFDGSDPSVVEQYVGLLEDSSLPSEVLEMRLRHLTVEHLHALLKAVTSHSSAATLIQRVARIWVGRLLNRCDGDVLRAAVVGGSPEALSALLALGSVVVAPSENTDHKGDSGRSLLCLCVERGDVVMMSLLLEHLRGGQQSLDGVREAQSLAVSGGRAELADALNAHLVVELSLAGNLRYRNGEFGDAIKCYEEAISCCEDAKSEAQGNPPDDFGEHVGMRPVDDRTRENLVRLRYNLARAFHRTDRWAEAREQASIVISLDPAYSNAHALRAQAAMASCNWQNAQADWDQLLTMDDPDRPATEIAAWSKRRDECMKQLSLGHYEVLDLPRFSSNESVKRSYRDLARLWHPDKHQHEAPDLQDRAARQFSRIQEAYEVLSNDSSKRAYDSSLLLRDARSTVGSSVGVESSDPLRFRSRGSSVKSGLGFPTCSSGCRSDGVTVVRSPGAADEQLLF